MILILSLFVGCFYRKGPALMHELTLKIRSSTVHVYLSFYNL